jgi:hypothetical protein
MQSVDRVSIDELEANWEEAFMAESGCSPDICMEALRNTTKILKYGHVPVEFRTAPFRI